MKAVEQEKLENMKNQVLVLFEMIEVSRDALFYSKNLRPAQVGIVLDIAAKEADVLLTDITKLIKNELECKDQHFGNKIANITKLSKD